MADEDRTRKANLESTISEAPNARGYYEAKVWMGFKANGKPDRRHVQRKSLAAVRAQVKKLERDREDGNVTAAGRPPTVQEMLTRHIDVIMVAAKRSPKTRDSYRSLAKNHIFPRWGEQRADRLTPEHIEDALAELQRAGMADSSIRKMFAVLSSAYSVQVARGNLQRNPCAYVTPPDVPEGDMTSLTVAEAAAIVETARKQVNGVRWIVALGHGLRQGEALGMRWSYLDLQTGRLRIWHQMQRLTWEHGCWAGDERLAAMSDQKAREKRVAELEHACGDGFHRHPCPKPCPKVRKSGRRHECVKAGDKGICAPGCRGHAAMCPEKKGGGLVIRPVKEKRHKTISLSDEFLELLREHRDAQYLQRITADREWDEHDLVFSQWNGGPIDPRRDWADWKKLLELAGLPPQRVHVMRHSATSILLGEGVGIRVVQKMLGHADIRTTEGYAHVNEAQSKDASQRIGRALGLPSARERQR